MKPLWSRLRSPLAAAGLTLCLAACEKPVARAPRAAPPSPAPVPAFSDAAGPPRPPFYPVSPPASARAPAPPSQKHDLASLAALAETDPRAALLAADTTDLGGAAPYIRGNLLQQWAARDFSAALAHADFQPPGAIREEMFGRLALVLAKSLPREAAAIVADDMAPGEIRAEAAISVLHHWLREDPSAAAGWAAAFPPGPLCDRALAEVVNASTAPAR